MARDQFDKGYEMVFRHDHENIVPCIRDYEQNGGDY